MPLLSLPNELLLSIAESFDHAYKVNSLLLSSRRLAILLTPLLNTYALKPKHSTTALYWAAANGNEPMAKLILTKGPKITISTTSTKSHQPQSPCPDVLVRYVMEQSVNLTLQDQNGTNWIPFHWAARNANFAMIKMLISCGADVDTRDHQGRTSLHLGSWFRQDVVKAFLENGADIGARDQEGSTPLHTAVRYSKHTAQVLLENGADPNAMDVNGSTPLHLAADSSRGCAGLLLEHGADISARDNSGRTPLHLAAKFKGGAETVRLLLEWGADMMARDNEGRTVPLSATTEQKVPAGPWQNV